MKVILTRDVPKVGKDGDIVMVADGYARNYLFPRQLALVAKGAAMKEHSNRLAREVTKSANLLSDAQAASAKLNGASFQILAKASPKSTRLFGAITEADVAETILKETGVIVDKRKISLIDPIKVTGAYELNAKLHPDITVPFTINVVTQEQLDTAERQRVLAEEKAVKEAEKAAQMEADKIAAAEAAAQRQADAAEAKAKPAARAEVEDEDYIDAEG